MGVIKELITEIAKRLHATLHYNYFNLPGSESNRKIELEEARDMYCIWIRGVQTQVHAGSNSFETP